MISLLQTTAFIKAYKKLHKNQKRDIDFAIEKLMRQPFSGEQKKGDLSQVRVYKFHMVKQVTLLAYKYYNDSKILTLLEFGPHENFYRDLKN